jgi:prepilin-type processing-associated H-X9-DG protein
MAKIGMTCPFSKGKCIECAIYRGRHANICFADGYHGGEFKSLMESRPKPKNGSTNLKFELPDIPDSPTQL